MGKPRSRQMIFFTLVISLVINLYMMLMWQVHDSKPALPHLDNPIVSIKDMVYRIISDFDITSETTAKALLLDSLLTCVIGKLEGNVDEAASTTENSTSDSGLSPDTLQTLNNKLQTVAKRQAQVIEFLSQPAISQYNYTYLHLPAKSCAERPPEVLFVTPSTPDHFKHRQDIRKGIVGQYVSDPRNKARLLFFLGQPPDNEQGEQDQQKIDEEAESEGDIVQEEFLDVYKNILLKAMSMLRWVSTSCSSVHYVIRADDDVRVLPDKLVSAMQRAGQKFENFILGNRAEKWEPIRIPENKYYVSEMEYAKSTFPPFSLGGLLGYPLSTVRLLFQAALREKPLWLDDVFLTGLCAAKVNIPLLEDRDFSFKHGG